jgi:hypothetical protein
MEPREGAGMVARLWEVVGAQLAARAVALMARWRDGVGARGGTCGIYIVVPHR